MHCGDDGESNTNVQSYIFAYFYFQMVSAWEHFFFSIVDAIKLQIHEFQSGLG